MITIVITMTHTALITMKLAIIVVMAEWEHIQAEDTEEAAQETVIAATEAI